MLVILARAGSALGGYAIKIAGLILQQRAARTIAVAAALETVDDLLVTAGQSACRENQY